MSDQPPKTVLESKPVRAELVEALAWFFAPLCNAARSKIQPFDKLRANGVGIDK
jgi:hypothetical protein